jgi:hypothetical protein
MSVPHYTPATLVLPLPECIKTCITYALHSWSSLLFSLQLAHPPPSNHSYLLPPTGSPTQSPRAYVGYPVIVLVASHNSPPEHVQPLKINNYVCNN